MRIARHIIMIAGLVALVGLGAGASTAEGTPQAQTQKKLTIGFVTHFVGNPFIKQVAQAARDAGKDLGVTVKITGTPGFDPAAQLKIVQDLFASGADGVSTSITG
ncbi:MAG: substrate-binding domain-containing protein, partial [Actinobacteria bacterium]|nr:substrate-binding domain-containing protein [Actinomycetota bacterium]